MAEIVLFNPTIHMEQLRQLCMETYKWHREALLERHQIDYVTVLGRPIPEMIEARLNSLINLGSSRSAVYILESEGESAGMGAIHKISEDTGEIGLMYTRLRYRRRGYARRMLSKLLETGREMGCSTFWLLTPKFSVAPHLYRSVGFMEKEYPENKLLNPELMPYWYFMEKIES